MNHYFKEAEKQHKNESKSLSFASWCVCYMEGLAAYDGAARLALAQVIVAGRRKEAIPVSLADLVRLAFTLRAEVGIRVTHWRTNAYSFELINAHESLSEQLLRLFNGAGVGADPIACSLLRDPEISFETLFELAARAGYVLKVRLFYDNQEIASKRFNDRYPDLYDVYRRSLRRFNLG